MAKSRKSKRDGVNITSRSEFRPPSFLGPNVSYHGDHEEYRIWAEEARKWLDTYRKTHQEYDQVEIKQGDRRRSENKDRFLLRSGLRAPLVLRNRTKMGRPYRLSEARLGFQFPGHTMVCKRRKDRRRAVFSYARRLTRRLGSGGGKNVRRVLRGISLGRHLWNEASHITC